MLYSKVNGTDSWTPSDKVDIYKGSHDGAGTHMEETLSKARGNLASAANSRFAIFAGGSDGGADVLGGIFYDTVDIYDMQAGEWVNASLTLSEPRALLAGAHSGNVFAFGGGIMAGGEFSSAIDYFIFNETAQTWSYASGQLSQARGFVSATQASAYIIFAGGSILGGVESNVVDVVETNTFDTFATTLSEARSLPAYLTVTGTDGFHYAVFAGGSDDVKVNSKKVDYFVTPPMPTPPPTVEPTPAPQPTPAPSRGLGAGDVVLIILGSLLVVGGLVWCLRAKKRRPLDGEQPLLKD